MSQIIVSNIVIDVVRKDIKNIHLAVYPPDGRVRIAVPLKTNDEAIRLFAVSKISWIRKQQEKFNNQERQTEREFVSGESHFFMGNRYLLNVIYGNHAPKVNIRNKKYIDLYVKEGSSKEKREEILNEWYRNALKAEIPSLIEKWESIIGVKVNSWGVKNMKTKWGTCNTSANRIWLNLQLGKKPLHCLEYVVVHEMVHLLERHHNEKFMYYMDKFLPEWRSFKEELNNLVFDNSDWDY